ncbi:MAG: TerC family protein [Verrucomicrobiaceae bacterium]|nr:MAG: TerC family protein [Verrucomicrobiaceae bacterium]
MDWIMNPELWIAFLTLCALEIVLGIDNVIFISILAGKLPSHQQDKARVIGLGLAMIMRILLLLTISWMAGLTNPWITVFGHGLSGRDLILVVGGLFLVAKSTSEIHGKLEGEEGHGPGAAAASFAAVLIQIMLLDIVFSLDSVITAVGMVNNIPVMIGAVVISVIFMMFFSGPISRFVEAHPTIKMLALSFLLLIGVTLIADGFGQHVSKGYIYFAMGFSVFVEMLNLKLIKKSQKPVHLHQPYSEDV